jgi:hypothetical protein
MNKRAVKGFAVVAVATLGVLGSPIQNKMDMFGSMAVQAAEPVYLPVLGRVELDGQTLAFPDQQAVVTGDVALVPVDGLFEALGWTIGWDAENAASVLSKGGRTLFVPLGKDRFMIQDEGQEARLSEQLNTTIVAMGDRLMVPLGVITEGAGLTVTLDGSTISITTSAAQTETPTGPYTPVLWDEAKYGHLFDYNMQAFYLWQKSKLTSEQNKEANALSQEWWAAGKPTNWPADKMAMVYCAGNTTYRIRLDMKSINNVAPVPTTGGPYAALHQITKVGGEHGFGANADVVGWMSEREVSEKLESLRTKYPQGLRWGRDEGGCNAFALLIRNELFESTGKSLESLQIRSYNSSVVRMPLSEVKVGDYISHTDENGVVAHVFVVLGVDSDHFDVVEGNLIVNGYGIVNWGREQSFDEMINVYKSYTVGTYYSPRYKPEASVGLNAEEVDVREAFKDVVLPQ